MAFLYDIHGITKNDDIQKYWNTNLKIYLHLINKLSRIHIILWLRKKKSKNKKQNVKKLLWKRMNQTHKI